MKALLISILTSGLSLVCMAHEPCVVQPHEKILDILSESVSNNDTRQYTMTVMVTTEHRECERTITFSYDEWQELTAYKFVLARILNETVTK